MGVRIGMLGEYGCRQDSADSMEDRDQLRSQGLTGGQDLTSRVGQRDHFDWNRASSSGVAGRWYFAFHSP